MAEPIRAKSSDVERTVTDFNGPAGREWRRRLPAIVAECAERWSLTLSPAFEDLAYSCVAPAMRADGTRMVLKIGFLTGELRNEMEALRIFSGRGSVLLLEADEEAGALLLEHALPGRPLSEIADDEGATVVAAELMRELWRPAPRGHSFPTVAKWGAGLQKLRQRFRGNTGPLPAELVEKAEGLLGELLASTTEDVLLHGDCHHYNILTAERRPWLAIDPKGVVGDPAYEVGMFLGNPAGLLARPRPDDILARRLDVLAEALGIERERLRAWGVVQQVLSAWWSIEDQGCGWEDAITRAELLTAIGP